MAKIFYVEPKLSRDIEYHSHDYAQIALQTKGEFHLFITGKEYVITPDYMVIIPPNVLHGYQCNETDKTILFNISSDMVNKSDRELLVQNPILKVSSRMGPIIETIKAELKENNDSDCVTHLFYYVYNKFLEQCQIKSVQYINLHYAQDITVAKLAEIENYNVSYYSEWFKQKTGFSPSDFIQNTRIEKAKILLINTQLKITEIANRVGYTNNSAFARSFGNIAGVSPSLYREINFQNSGKEH